MVKKITLGTLSSKIDALTGIVKKGFVSVDSRMERGFAAVADDIADGRKEMATKEQVIALHTQVNSIEGQLRGMKHVKLEGRVADVEEKVFGKIRA